MEKYQHKPSKENHNAQIRQRIAQQAAQFLLQRGDRDFYAAKQKAADYLGVVESRNLPNNTEIEQALIEYQRIFYADSQLQHLNYLREIAIEAMQFLSRFKPQLVGAVLSGSTDQNSPVELHVFSGTVEEIKLFLLNYKIPHKESQKKVRFKLSEVEELPQYCFMVNDVQVELVVFTEKQKQPPLSPVDGKTMKRADITEVEKLLAQV